ncbi:MAG: hypothetical protein GX786_11030 [Clostridiales bacterium]|nr:hypothetical protein [Clostridiales bacterium]
MNDFGLKYLGQIETKEFGELPLYSMGGFINTEEGWNLYVACGKRGNMGPYNKAKAEYLEEPPQVRGEARA